MSKTPDRLVDASNIRRRAEACWRERKSGDTTVRTDATSRRLLHELEVHQIELEMQSAELDRTRTEAAAALKNFTELYDFAPVGYLSIDQQGLIQEVNLSASTMLGAPRSRIRQRPFEGFVAPASRKVVKAYLRAVFARPGNHTCEALLLTTAGATFCVDLHANSAAAPKLGREWCRLALSDASARKRAEEVQRQVDSLAATNLEANREIARRLVVEATLRETEESQRKSLEESRELHAQMRRLTHQVLMCQEEERKQISRELHDQITQILAGIKVQLIALAAVASTRPNDLRKRILATQRLVGHSIDVVHRFARELRPALLDDLGLIPALRSHIRELAKRKDLRIDLTADAAVEELDNQRRTVLFRIAQEALKNVLRHARARNATLRLLKLPDAIRLEVHDDGKSLPTSRLLLVKKTGRLGLVGMRERVEMVGGRFAIESAPGKGTTVIAEIPHPPRARRSPRAIVKASLRPVC